MCCVASWRTRPPPSPRNNTKRSFRPYVASTQSCLGRCLRVCRRVHGDRSRRPDSQADRRQPRCIGLAGVAVVHQLHGGDGRRDADHRRGGEPDRSQTHAAARPRRDHRRRRPGRHVRHRSGNRWLAGTLGTRQCAVHRDRTGHHRQLRTRLRRTGDHSVRGRAGARHRRRPTGRRCSRVDLVARPVLRGVRADGGGRRGHCPPAAVHAARRTRDHIWPTRSGRCATVACSASQSPRCCTTSASSPCWRSRRSRST